MSLRRSLVARDQEVTPFGSALMRFCEGTAALGASLVDSEGETVDYAGSIEPFDIKVAAAEWRLVLRLVAETRSLRLDETNQLLVRGGTHSFLAVPLTEGYALVAQLERHAFEVSARALTEAVRELSREAGLELPQCWESERWIRVEVLTSAKDPRRPEAIWRDGRWRIMEILGRFASDLDEREVGFRARLETGGDITIVREPLGVWYADDLPDV
jgi:hypothetical protein